MPSSLTCRSISARTVAGEPAITVPSAMQASKFGAALHVEPRCQAGLAVHSAQPVQMREMQLHRRLAETKRLSIGIGDENVPLHADRRATGKFCSGLRRAAALFQRALKASILALATVIGPSVTKCRPSSPAKVEPISLDEPYQNGGCGCCSGRSAIGTFS